MKTNTTTTRVLVAEDSLSARELLVSILQSAPGLQVVGTARNGVEAVRLAKRLKPDVITMDVHMPEMDGFEAARQIMATIPCPIVMISNSMSKHEREFTFGAMQAGALSVLDKPSLTDPPEVFENLALQVKLMSEVKVIKRWDDSAKTKQNVLDSFQAPPLQKSSRKSKIQIIVIASSTGGPGILMEILKTLPADFPIPILIVQHITAGFSTGLATWLDQHTLLKVRLAAHADEPQAGQVLIAPDGYHTVVNGLGLIALIKKAPKHGLRPAADYLFESVAQVYGATAMGIILSGMGSDGAEGLLAMRQTGAYTVALDKKSCVVFGMPAVAIELGAAEQILPTGAIAPAMMTLK